MNVQRGTSESDNLTSSSVDETTGADTLIGFDGDDTYTFFDGFGMDRVEEEINEGIDTLDFSGVTTDLTFEVRNDADAMDVEIKVLDDVLATNAVDAFNVENLVGGSGRNTFKFFDTATLLGSITGGEPTTSDPETTRDVLDFSEYNAAVTFDLQDLKVTGIAGEVVNIAKLVGSMFGNNTLIGVDQARIYANLRRRGQHNWSGQRC